jgi:hypothetical protein
MSGNRAHPRLAAVALIALAIVGPVGCARSGSAPAASAGQPAVTTPQQEPAGEASVAATPAAPDPCSLVSKQDAERLARTRLNDARPAAEACTYTGPVTGPTAQVEVYVGDGAKKFLDIERELKHELRPLPGVGDEAYASFEAVFVNKSGLWVTVRLVRLNDPTENRKPLEDLARTVATRI